MILNYQPVKRGYMFLAPQPNTMVWNTVRDNTDWTRPWTHIRMETARNVRCADQLFRLATEVK